jgi:PAS domain S-box-containing protein
VNLKLSDRLKSIVELLTWKTAPSVVLLLSLALTGLAWYYATKAVRRETQTVFARQVSEATNSLDFRIQTYINTLRASQALFAASQSVERNEWKVFIESLNLRSLYPGVNGIGFIRYVPNNRKAAYEEWVRQDTSVDPKGYPDFAIKPAGDRQEYFIIEYIEPLAPNRPAMGFDVVSDPVRSKAVRQARDTGEAAATGRIILVQDTTRKPGFLILLPVYRHQMPHKTVAEKRRALKGFIYAPLRTINLVEEALPNVLKQDLHLKIYNGKDLMYDSGSSMKVRAKSLLHQVVTLNVAGEKWQLYFSSVRATQAFWAPTSILVLASGTLISLLLFVIVRSLTSARRRALQLANAMTTDLRASENRLRHSEKRYRAIVEDQTEFIARFDLNNQLTFVNQAYCRYFNLKPEELIGKNFQDFVVLEDRENLARHLDALILDKPSETIEYRVMVNGQVRYLQWSDRVIFDEQGKFVEFQSVGQDISDRKQTEQALQESESTLRSFFDSAAMMMGIIEVCDDGIIHISDNAASANFFDTTPEAIQEKPLHEWIARCRESEHSKSPIRFEYSYDGATGSMWLAATVCAIAPMPNGRSRFSYIVEDITERKHSEEKITASLSEKEVLLKEIHHRVKNNLQVICSLLNLQARSLKDATTITLFQETQNRVRSMALVHEKLYQSNNLSQIELGEYLHDLSQNLSTSYPIDCSKVVFKTDIQSNIFLDIDVAVPCGLIVNELISNSLKYAFASGEEGEIYLQALLNEEQKLVLTVGDNGKGFPDDFDLEKSRTLGLKLVKALTNQLEGKLELDRSCGTKFKILLTRIDN